MCFNNFHLLLNPTKLNTSFTQVVMQPFVTGAIMDNTGGSDKKQNKKSTLFTAFSHKNVEKKKKTLYDKRATLLYFFLSFLPQQRRLFPPFAQNRRGRPGIRNGGVKEGKSRGREPAMFLLENWQTGGCIQHVLYMFWHWTRWSPCPPGPRSSSDPSTFISC